VICQLDPQPAWCWWGWAGRSDLLTVAAVRAIRAAEVGRLSGGGDRAATEWAAAIAGALADAAARTCLPLLFPDGRPADAPRSSGLRSGGRSAGGRSVAGPAGGVALRGGLCRCFFCSASYALLALASVTPNCSVRLIPEITALAGGAAGRPILAPGPAQAGAAWLQPHRISPEALGKPCSISCRSHRRAARQSGAAQARPALVLGEGRCWPPPACWRAASWP